MPAEREGARGTAVGSWVESRRDSAIQAVEALGGWNKWCIVREGGGEGPRPFTNRFRAKGGLNNNLKVTQAGSRQLPTTAYEGRGRRVATGGGGGADQV